MAALREPVGDRARPEIAYDVKFGGRTEAWTDEHGRRHRVRWIPDTEVKGVAYDTPILGYRVGTCNRLRLWKAEAVESFDFAAFNHGDYYRAVEDKMESENITKVLYPNDEVAQGKTLRLQQQYFFVTCSLQDMIRVQLGSGRPLDEFHEKWAVQLNDTHPAIAVAELMRLLVDEHLMDWDTAWEVTRQTFAYTNHTLLPEALEKWPVGLFGQLLPRHLEIIYEINARFLDEVRARFPGRRRAGGAHVADRRERRALRPHGEPGHRGQPPRERRGATAFRAASEDGDAGLRRDVAGEVQQRHQRRHAAPVRGASAIRRWRPDHRRIGDGWLRDLDRLRQLEPLADDAAFQRAVA